MRREPIKLRDPRPKTAPKATAHPLVRELFGLMAEEQIGVTDVAERAGISVTTVVKWKTRHAPTVVALEAALNVVGYRLAIVEKPDAALAKEAGIHTRGEG